MNYKIEDKIKQLEKRTNFLIEDRKINDAIVNKGCHLQPLVYGLTNKLDQRENIQYIISIYTTQDYRRQNKIHINNEIEMYEIILKNTKESIDEKVKEYIKNPKLSNSSDKSLKNLSEMYYYIKAIINSNKNTNEINEIEYKINDLRIIKDKKIKLGEQIGLNHIKQKQPTDIYNMISKYVKK